MSRVNGMERATGELADGVLEERQLILEQLIREMPELTKRARKGAEPKSLDSLVLAMTSYIAMWMNESFADNDALKAHMLDTITNGLALLTGFAVESETIVEAPTEH